MMEPTAENWSAEIIPSAFVNEKWVSAFEFNKMMPRPSSRSGGSAIGNAFDQRSSSAP